MSEETATLEAPVETPSTPVAASESDQGTPTSLFSGTPAEHPLDSMFSEEILSKIPDGPQKNWLASQKNGEGLMKGIAGFQQLAGKKGFERPAEDAPDEVKSAFADKLKELNGVPAALEEYKVALPEGAELDESIQSELNKYGFENGIPPKHIEALLPLQAALQQKSEEARIQAEGEKLVAMFENSDALKKAEPALQQYAKDQGYDLDDPSVKNAAFWKSLHHSMQLEAKIAHLTGEDVAVQGGFESSKSVDAQIEAFVDPKGSDYEALFNPMNPNHRAAKQRFDDLTMAKAQKATQSR